ncbi:MAG: GNAT family N-acetyltransferase [Anaerolineae bacterium]|nr:GNAT family N-acetyltransferase [Anaerolineae bacterium]
MDAKEAIVRPARPEDALQAGYLMYLSGPGPSETIWGGPASNAIRVWRELFPIPKHMYSYSHALVADWNSRVVGLLLGLDPKSCEMAQRAMGSAIRFKWFKIIRLWHFPYLIGAIINMARTFEPLSDEDYSIQALAVLPEARRQGIATRLMESAADQARSKGLKRVVLDVLIDNEDARRFYERVGFREVKRITDPRFCRWFGVQGSIRMAKDIASLSAT